MEKSKVALDTSAFSAFLCGNEDVVKALQGADEIVLPSIVLGELRAGFLMGKHRLRNESVLKEFLASSRVRVRNVDEETSERYAAIFAYLREQGTPIPTNDIWIAASAMQHGLKLITTDKHYLKLPQVIVECCQV